MSDLSEAAAQTHPLEATDRDHIDRLLSREVPRDGDLAELARLLIRYDGFPGSSELQRDMDRLLSLWKLSREDLNNRVRQLWAQGFRPGQATDETVGSGFDTSENETG